MALIGPTCTCIPCFFINVLSIVKYKMTALYTEITSVYKKHTKQCSSQCVDPLYDNVCSVIAIKILEG